MVGPQEERLPSKVHVHGEFPEPLPSRWYPDSFIAQASSILLAEGSEGGEILGFPGTCDPELSRLEPHLILLPSCTDWWLSNPHGLCPWPFSFPLRWLPLAQETGCAPANGLEVLSPADPDSQEVLREAEVWRENADCSLAPGV